MASRKKWTDEDVEFLKENHFKLTVPEMAEHLGITISSVTNKLKRLKLSYASSDDRLKNVPKPSGKSAKASKDEKTVIKQPADKPDKRSKNAITNIEVRSKADMAHRAKAVELYEKAIRQFHQIDRQKPLDQQRRSVKELFNEIISNYSSEIDVCYKAKSYYNYISNLEKPDASPKDIEAKITEGIIYLQTGSTKDAMRIFRSIAKTEPHNSYNLYCLACAYAKENDTKNALKTLKDAVKFDPTLKFIAENDKDLVNLYENQEFSKIISFKS